MTRCGSAALAIGAALTLLLLAPSSSRAISLGPLCSVAGFVNGLAGRACTVVAHAAPVLGKAKRVVTGARALGAGRGLASAATITVVLAGVAYWIETGARKAMRATGRFLAETTTPRLTVPWFTATYWRVAGIAALLTVPFLAAAAVQSVLSGDLALLLRAGLGYLPLALLGVGVLAPLATLALAATDVMCGLVSSAAGVEGGSAIATSSGAAPPALGAANPAIDMVVATVVLAGSVVLWLELLVREAAVDVVVLLMPLTFAAMVWPARRIWAVRAVELLLALVLGKFVVVAVLSLGAGALGHPLTANGAGLLMGAALVGLAACAPWAVLRLVPFGEAASAAATSLRGEVSRPVGRIGAHTERLLPGDRTADETVTASPPESASAAVRAVMALSTGRPGQAGAAPGSVAEPPETPTASQDVVAGLPSARPAGACAGGGAGATGTGATDAAVGTGGPVGAIGISGEAGADSTAAGVSTPPTPPTPSPSTAGSEPAGTPSANTPGEPAAERIPGLGAMWQLDDMSWRPIDIGPGAEWPPRLVDGPEPPSGGPALPPPRMGLPDHTDEEGPCDGR